MLENERVLILMLVKPNQTHSYREQISGYGRVRRWGLGKGMEQVNCMVTSSNEALGGDHSVVNTDE